MTTKLLRPVPRANTLHIFKPTRRTFITLPGSEPQHLSTTRILPYSSSSLYTIIADVDSYSTFLPYCLCSRVTKWSAPDASNKRWPSQADLTVGWGGYEETFTSRLFCVPGSIVEALGGEAITKLPHSQLQHHSETLNIPAQANSVFQTITTRWTLKPFHYKPPTGQLQTDDTVHPSREQTEVHLSLDFQFSNPVYAALSKAVAPKIAGVMIEAFEVRARKLLDGPGAAVQDVLTEKKIEAQ
jgi:coenzyme Q-binding protein COQ10